MTIEKAKNWIERARRDIKFLNGPSAMEALSVALQELDGAQEKDLERELEEYRALADEHPSGDDCIHCGERPATNRGYPWCTVCFHKYRLEAAWDEWKMADRRYMDCREKLWEAKRNIIEVDAALSTDGAKRDYEEARLGLVRMAHEVRAALDELNEYRDRNHWISVKDELPRPGQWVRVYLAGPRTENLGPSSSYRRLGIQQLVRTNGRRAETDATHWRPLPAPPKEE